MAYRHKYGPLNPVRKYDAGAALISSLVAQLGGNKATAKDFMPWGKEGEQLPDVLDNLEDILKTGRVKITR